MAEQWSWRMAWNRDATLALAAETGSPWKIGLISNNDSIILIVL